MALLDFKNFPFVLPFWRPPPAIDSPRWRYLDIFLSDERVHPHDILSSLALALRIEGTPRSATFNVVLPGGPVQIIYPSSDDPDLAGWRPEHVHPMKKYIATLKLDHSSTVEELRALAIATSAPLLISQSLVVGSSYLQATYDRSTVTESEVGWLLIHMSRALHSFRARRRSLILGSLLCSAMRQHIFHSKTSALSIPPWTIFFILSTLNRLRGQRDRELSSISPMDCAERMLFRGTPEPPARNFRITVPLPPLCCTKSSSAMSDNDPRSFTKITYASVHSIALRLAAKLGVLAQSVVPIALVDPVDIAISMIAVLLAGATYVIVDPAAIDDQILQQCLSLGQSQSQVTLVYQIFHNRFNISGCDLVDPNNIIQNLLQDNGVEYNYRPPPSIVAEDIAFFSLASISGEPFAVTPVTHTLAIDSIRDHFFHFDITEASKVLVTGTQIPFLLHAVVWNTFAHGGTVHSATNLDYHAFTKEASQCTHVVLPSGKLGLVASALGPSTFNVTNELLPVLPTLIIPGSRDDVSLTHTLDQGRKIIKYNGQKVILKENTDLINMDIDILFRSDNDTTITPTEVLALLPPDLPENKLERSVVKIRDGLVVKYGGGVTTIEVHSLNFVRKHTSIRVPFIHLLFRQKFCTYLVMQHIDAPTLEQQWNDLDEDMRTSTVSQFGEALQQLRALENPTLRPGPIDDTRCCGPWFTIYNAGPFETHASLVQWLNHKIEATAKHAEPFTEDYRLVFTHQDLALRNLILDKEGQLWIIDWELAGWYPAYFEYACVASMPAQPPDWVSRVLPHLGQYEYEYRSLQALAWGLERIPFA